MSQSNYDAYIAEQDALWKRMQILSWINGILFTGLTVATGALGGFAYYAGGIGSMMGIFFAGQLLPSFAIFFMKSRWDGGRKYDLHRWFKGQPKPIERALLLDTEMDSVMGSKQTLTLRQLQDGLRNNESLLNQKGLHELGRQLESVLKTEEIYNFKNKWFLTKQIGGRSVPVVFALAAIVIAAVLFANPVTFWISIGIGIACAVYIATSIAQMHTHKRFMDLNKAMLCQFAVDKCGVNANDQNNTKVCFAAINEKIAKVRTDVAPGGDVHFQAFERSLEAEFDRLKERDIWGVREDISTLIEKACTGVEQAQSPSHSIEEYERTAASAMAKLKDATFGPSTQTNSQATTYSFDAMVNNFNQYYKTYPHVQKVISQCRQTCAL